MQKKKNHTIKTHLPIITKTSLPGSYKNLINKTLSGVSFSLSLWAVKHHNCIHPSSIYAFI